MRMTIQPPSIAPSTVTSQWPPRIIAKEVSALKKEAPGNAVTGCLPALIRSQSSAPALISVLGAAV